MPGHSYRDHMTRAAIISARAFSKHPDPEWVSIELGSGGTITNSHLLLPSVSIGDLLVSEI
ncbi:hypothetical protein MES4922_10225 [Mesorhizobium ventifaucium]|uniref:Uncharacterized protein n=1 Tax=Mesorhizobium ventifaucium TaxID=666020 RepID=A0ABM9DCQ9_9HYPH|nr:hypothetical protein MES4922_10225 [Mesorhizobium ventifaucium]